MNTIKTYIFDHFKVLAIITLSVMISMTLLMIRSKITLSFFYLFLVWNLFLAFIPFAISTYVKANARISKFALVFWLSVWLLFLPNAPYIVTDFIHLRSQSAIVWYDIFMVSAFAISGLFLFYFSIRDLQCVLSNTLSKLQLNVFGISMIFLSSFGVYLGRFLRYNSWEILERPHYLISDIFSILIQPMNHKGAWAFTLVFGGFLLLGFWLTKRIYIPSTKA